ncbi:MAG: hypothetical protein HYX47_21635 [Burkholderiales bacterium]|nr:hypothetical protein [Burkholderiales bacterium]
MSTSNPEKTAPAAEPTDHGRTGSGAASVLPHLAHQSLVQSRTKDEDIPTGGGPGSDDEDREGR